MVWAEYERDLNPKNWPFFKKLGTTLLVTAISFTVQYASAIDSAVAEKIQAEFGVDDVVESLATGLAPNIGAQITLRFLAGFFGSSPLIYIFPIYATGGFLGLAVGPAIGGVIGESGMVGWRWVEWSTLIISAVVFLPVLLVQPETHAPTLLKRKSKMATARPANERSAIEINDDQKSIAKASVLAFKLAQSFYRPFQLALYEPIVILLSFYLSLLYIIVFTFLPGYTFIFTETYGFNMAQRGLCFLGLGVGFLMSLAMSLPVLIISRRIVDRHGELYPESRLYHAIFGAPTIPIAMLWMGWTAKESISPWSAIVASALLGFGVLCIFISSYQYTIHTYRQYAASGLVFITLTRYLAAGGMVIVGSPMYRSLGVNWTLTILGCIGGLLVPIPYCLYWLGPAIRKWSKHSS
ncbi:Major facilitator superfamily domain, general substrate transporter [Penicillium occitanis (nom. inval.)]|nr:Major facilitator superfamily domain, general substrate transporter [Penicillium occitanis (nom. inval.)]PCH07455.1 hypothetical protein PENOC_019050 [Penicillium occitanis (nom. inval.)]